MLRAICTMSAMGERCIVFGRSFDLEKAFKLAPRLHTHTFFTSHCIGGPRKDKAALLAANVICCGCEGGVHSCHRVGRALTDNHEAV